MALIYYLIFTHEKFCAAVLLLLVLIIPKSGNSQEADYIEYHRNVIRAEEYIAKENFYKALKTYDSLISNYEFVYKREYQVASQLAFLLDNKTKGLRYLESGIKAGWTLKSIRTCEAIKVKLNWNEWRKIRHEYADLRKVVELKQEGEIAMKVKRMYRKDQRKALLAFLRITSKAQDRFAEKSFASHSKNQISDYQQIMKVSQYPGERRIGNDYWMSTILSHHNSISKPYTQRDKLYPVLRQRLLKEIQEGYISPYVFAIIDEWYAAMFEKAAYGILTKANSDNIATIDANRAQIGMRPVHLRNDLVDIELKTKLDLYLEIGNWLVGKIEVRDK